MHVVLTLVKFDRVKIEGEDYSHDGILVQTMTDHAKIRGCEFTAVSPIVATPFGTYMIIIDSHDCPAGR